jgi:hypothetical protein
MSVLRLNKTKCVKRVQWRYRKECGHDSDSAPPIYAVYRQFWETGSLRQEEIPLLQNVWMKLEYQLDVF